MTAAPSACRLSPRAPLEITAVVPVYRSAAILPELYRRLTDALVALADRHEIILVEDFGGDDSWSVIEGLADRDDCVRGIRMSRNYGQHNALLCGIRAARYPIDRDAGRRPPEPARGDPQAARARSTTARTSSTARPSDEQHGFLRDQSSRITKLALQGAMGAETARHVSAFRAFRTRLRDAFATYRGPYVSIDVLLTWGTTRFSHVTVRHEPRAMGASNYTFRKLVTHAFNMMTGFSTLPLQIASVIGFLFTFFGFLILLYVLDQLPHERRGASRASPSSPRSSRSSAARSCSRSGSSASTSPGCTFARWTARPTWSGR